VQGTDHRASVRIPTDSKRTWQKRTDFYIFVLQLLERRITIPLQCECFASFSASSTYFRMLFILSSVEPLNPFANQNKKIDVQLFFLTERTRQHGLELQRTEGRTSMKR
jgi:hypothetical protein